MQPVLDRGGMRWTWLRGRETMHKRYLLHVAGHNLSLFMSRLIGVGKSTTLLFPDNRFRLPTTVARLAVQRQTTGQKTLYPSAQTRAHPTPKNASSQSSKSAAAL